MTDLKEIVTTGFGNVKVAVRDTADRLKRVGKTAVHQAKRKAHDVGDATKHAAHDVGDAAKHAAHVAGDAIKARGDAKSDKK